jgi:RHO1 GDP-GTP exchange protein 1/2
VASLAREVFRSSLELCSIIFQVIVKERQYVQDLDFIESVRFYPSLFPARNPQSPLMLVLRPPPQCFIKGLRRADPPVIPPQELEEFIEEVFGNISELRQCNRRLLDVLSVRQREQQPVIQRIGDVFLNAAADFRSVYPLYVGHLPVAEKRIKEEMETNAEVRRFLEVCNDVYHRFTPANIHCI